MPKTLDDQTLYASAERVLRYFYDMYKISGHVRLEFMSPRGMPDSDLNTVSNAYLYPLDDTARRSFAPARQYHLQYLEGDINPAIMGYDFVARIEPGKSPEDVQITVEYEAMGGNPEDQDQ